MTSITIHNKHFGKVSAILFLLAFILLTNIEYAPQYFNKAFKLSNTIVVVITILFLPICYFTYKKRLIWGYRCILWGILFSFSSILFMHFEDSLLEKYERKNTIRFEQYCGMEGRIVFSGYGSTKGKRT